MPCTDPFDAFKLATESLGEEIHLRASHRGLWINLIRRETYKAGTGLEQTTFTLGRSEATNDEEVWPLISLSNGSYTGSCGTTWNDVDYGFEEVTYHPEQFGLRGPVICKDDLIYNFKAERFLDGYLRALTKRSMRSLDNRYLNIYTHFVPKSIAKADFPTEDGATGDPPATPDLSFTSIAAEEDRIATSELTQEMLERVATELNEEGATDPDSDGWITLGEAGPVYPLLIGQEMSQRILFNDADRRQDYRDADSGSGMASLLMKRIGATRILGNFRHVINLFPPRYNFFTGVGYVRIPTWLMEAGTKGNVAVINPQWRTANYEAAYVLSPWVYTSEVIQPVNSAAGLNWNPTNYTGDWQFRTGHQISEDTDCYDPLEKLGRHFAEYKHAPRPIFPEFGRMIIFERCEVQQGLDEVTCSTTS